MKIKALILTLVAMISSFALFSCFSNNNDDDYGEGTRLTDAEGNSLADYQFDSDIYAYGYYVKEE